MIDVCVTGVVPCTNHGNLGRLQAAGAEGALVAKKIERDDPEATKSRLRRRVILHWIRTASEIEPPPQISRCHVTLVPN